LVVVSVSPNPVPQTAFGWIYTLTVSEKNGVATRLTSLVIDGASSPSFIAALNNGNIPARGTLSITIQATLTSVPFNRTFSLIGADADGKTWTQQITVPFIGPVGPLLGPGLSIVSTPKNVQQNPQADSSCQWAQTITLQEQNGYLIQLTGLTSGTTSFTSQLQQIFGSTRLAPFGNLAGTLCLTGLTVPSTRTITVTGVAENGATVSANVAVQYSTPVAVPATLSISSPGVQLAPDTSGNATSSVSVNFAGGSSQWTATILPGNRTTSWLTISPASGSGSSSISVQASATGLSPGVYQATIAIDAPGAVPESTSIPVTFKIGSAGDMSISGATNGASFKPVFAPGMLASVFGSNLAPSIQSAASLPLPLNIAGVSATVNGIAAPLYYVSGVQINLQIPYEVGAGPAVLAVNNNGQIASLPLVIAVVAPGMFGMWDVNGVPAASAKQGQVLISYITGEGDESPLLPTGATIAPTTPLANIPKPRLPVTVTVGGVSAPVAFYGIPSGVTGLTQINFTVPSNAPLGSQDVVVTVGSVAAPAVKLNVTAGQ